MNTFIMLYVLLCMLNLFGYAALANAELVLIKNPLFWVALILPGFNIYYFIKQIWIESKILFYFMFKSFFH
jgi:hypothetical protein